MSGGLDSTLALLVAAEAFKRLGYDLKNVTAVTMDADTTGRKDSHEKILTAFARGEADILLGTQMIAKGLDYPHERLCESDSLQSGG